jgi:uroporphyrinogen-III decarboxylase
MFGKEKILRAMTDGLDSDFPVVIPYMGIFVRDHWEELTQEPWWVMNLLDLDARLEVEETIQRKLNLDWVQTGLCPTREWRRRHRVRTFSGQFSLFDMYTSSIESITRPSAGGDHIDLKEPIIQTEEDIDEFFPTIKAEELIQTGMLDYVEKIVNRFGDEKFIVSTLSLPLWPTVYFVGFTETIKYLYRDQGLIKHMFRNLTSKNLELIKAYKNFGIDGIFFQDAFAGADTISLNHFNQVIKPFSEKNFSQARQFGLKSIYYMCGDVHDRLEKVVCSGSDCISFEESKKNFTIDLQWVNEVVGGRVSILGNLDAVNTLQNGTEKELEAEIIRQIGIGKEYGKFIMSLGSPVTPKTRVKKIIKYINLSKKLSA